MRSPGGTLGVVLLLTVSVSDSSGQINSRGARTLFARSFQYRSHVRLTRSREIREDGKEIENFRRQRYDRTVWENVFLYGVARDLTVMGVLPLVSDGYFEDLLPTPYSSRDTELAESTFLVQYDGVYHKNGPGSYSRVAGFFGVTPPWSQGVSLERVDLHQGAIFTHSTLRWVVGGDFEWTTSLGGGGLDYGERLRLDASVSYRALTYPQSKDLFLVAELNVLHEGKTLHPARGLVFDSTGGRLVFLSPGVEWFVQPKVALEFSVQLPVHQRLNGVQPGQGWIFVGGFRVTR
jgi:hypothetical protein